MKRASAIITDKGGRTSHAAIVSRELGIPCIVGAGGASRVLETGKEYTVDCSHGEAGAVYAGRLAWRVEKIVLKKFPRTRTKIMMNVGDPGSALELARLPNDGVGLCREEFIIASDIGVHPLAALEPKKLSPSLQKEMQKRSLGYRTPREFYVRKLAEGIGTIAAAFYPKPVIVRFSDFKTNEYETLLGGRDFEPKEENPMLGWRGASRYYDAKFKKAFELECEAMRIARGEFGLKNIEVMVPFCRTPEEGGNVLATMKEFGLEKGKDGLRVFVMCEIPANVIRASEFLDVFDGFSIGSNDLAQLTLGLDRDNATVAGIANERDEAVRILIRQAIEEAKLRGKYIGICGQAPSDYEDFAAFLVDAGIDSLSLNPDTIVKTTLKIAEKEKGVRSRQEI